MKAYKIFEYIGAIFMALTIIATIIPSWTYGVKSLGAIAILCFVLSVLWDKPRS